jgi:hypothetical protein
MKHTFKFQKVKVFHYAPIVARKRVVRTYKYDMDRFVGLDRYYKGSGPCSPVVGLICLMFRLY